MRTRTDFLAVVGAFVSELTLAQPTTPIVCLPNGTQVDVTDSVPSNVPAVGLSKG